MRSLSLRIATVFTLLLLGGVALAQQQSLMLGADTTTQPDGGILRRVQVDPQGRMVVTGISVNLADAGLTTGPVTYACTSRSQSVTSVGVAASTLPTALASRWMVRVCNSAENSGAPMVKCRDDGSNPTMGIANAGEVLEVGDCATYYTPVGIRCISDTAATAVTQAECE